MHRQLLSYDLQYPLQSSLAIIFVIYLPCSYIGIKCNRCVYKASNIIKTISTYHAMLPFHILHIFIYKLHSKYICNFKLATFLVLFYYKGYYIILSILSQQIIPKISLVYDSLPVST